MSENVPFDLEDPIWAWQQSDDVDWDVYGDQFRDSNKVTQQNLSATWKLVRVFSIQSNGFINAKRVRPGKAKIEHDRIFDRTEKLDTQDNVDYAKDKFAKHVSDIEAALDVNPVFIIYNIKRRYRDKPVNHVRAVFRYFPEKKEWFVAEFQEENDGEIIPPLMPQLVKTNADIPGPSRAIPETDCSKPPWDSNKGALKNDKKNCIFFTK